MVEAATDDDARGDAVGSAWFWNDEGEFAASIRAQAIAINRVAGTWAFRSFVIAYGHFLILMGLLFITNWSADRPDQRWRLAQLVILAFGLVMTALGGWIVYVRFYGYRRRMRNVFRDAPAAGLHLHYTFTPARLVSHSDKSDASNDWSVFVSAVEVRDGYILISAHRRSTWIPKHALEPPFDVPAASAFLRSKIARYRVVDRALRRSSPIRRPLKPSDVPSQAGPNPVVGVASFPIDREEFTRASRASLTAFRPWHRSRSRELLFFGFWHLLLVLGLYETFKRPATPDDRILGSLAPVLAASAAFVLWLGLYGVPRLIRASLRRYPLIGEEFTFTFTHERFISHNRLVDTSIDWSFVHSVVEFADGFFIRLKRFPGGYWVPDHALRAPFDHQQAAAFLRSRGVKYRVIDRAVGRGA
ncbi:YcxB family protein [Paludisphaera rhizosphaerae]|uniref:YcxB family protein n=1 Tax=Paludisphaera rhizosphaerae TaxID=2711216 RepID=UPI0013EC9061|nr:YcxB family protein [Paludisphaera rhizosphaerae]